MRAQRTRDANEAVHLAHFLSPADESTLGPSSQFSLILFNIHKFHNKFTKFFYTNTIHFGEN